MTILMTNLEVVIHEMKTSGQKYGQLEDKLMKLRGASRNLYGKFEKNLKEDKQLPEVEAAIEELLNQTWDS